jgi:hypothetical protein
MKGKSTRINSKQRTKALVDGKWKALAKKLEIESQ